MSELPTWARDALAGVYDPCCREKGISVLEMGLVRSVQVEDGVAKVELLLTSGWCPFAATVLTQVKEQILGQPGIRDADVSIVWDEGPAEITRDEPGRLAVTLHGSKLAGGFALTRTGERRWILVKTRDAAARPGSDIVAERPESVRTGRTWEEVAAGRPAG